MVFAAEDFKRTPEYQVAEKWFLQLPIPAPMDHSLILDHARKCFDEANCWRRDLEEKAESLLKFDLAIGLAVLAYLKTSQEWAEVSLAVIPFLALLGASCVLCFSVRMPAVWPTGMDLTSVYKLRDHYSGLSDANPEATNDRLRAKIAAGLYCGTEGLRAMINRRAHRLDWALVCAMLAPVLFALLLYCASPAVGKPVRPPGSTALIQPG